MAQWRKLRLVLFSSEGGARVSHWRNAGRGLREGEGIAGKRWGSGGGGAEGERREREMGSREPAPWRLGLPVGRLGQTG